MYRQVRLQCGHDEIEDRAGTDDVTVVDLPVQLASNRGAMEFACDCPLLGIGGAGNGQRVGAVVGGRGIDHRRWRGAGYHRCLSTFTDWAWWKLGCVDRQSNDYAIYADGIT